MFRQPMCPRSFVVMGFFWPSKQVTTNDKTYNLLRQNGRLGKCIFRFIVFIVGDFSWQLSIFLLGLIFLLQSTAKHFDSRGEWPRKMPFRHSAWTAIFIICGYSKKLYAHQETELTAPYLLILCTSKIKFAIIMQTL